MTMTKLKHLVVSGFVVLGLGAAYAHDSYTDVSLRALYLKSVRYSHAVEFYNFVVGDATHGQALFGVSSDDSTIDTSQALFQGPSVIYGNVVSNGTACSTCHRPEANFMLPLAPLSAHVPAGDPVITQRDAEAQGDPRQAALLENLGLLKQRPNRFNPSISEDDPYRKLFAWRKTQTIFNTVFGFGLLTDGRARSFPEQIRGAIFTHTQSTDIRFDDIANPNLPDIAAYMETEIRPAILKDLLDPTAPNYQNLVDNPFYSVPIVTKQQKRGQRVFEDNCMTCHNFPNVFGNLDHAIGPPPNFPPLYGHTFDIGVAERNAHDLDFRVYDAASGAYSTLTLPLTREDGAEIDITVVDDVGAAATTGRYEDLHRFKVPQLRNIASLGPYFHDNSAATLEDVVDYFNSDWYNRSIDGRAHPIHLDHDDRADLIAFLRIL
jgi:cytochrome c peroxidase